MDLQLDRQISKKTIGQVDKWTDGWMGIEMEAQRGRQMGGQTEGWADMLTNRERDTNGETDKQMERETNGQTLD